MLVDGCNVAQLTAWAYRAVYYNCTAQQVVHYFFERWKFTLWLYLNLFDTYYNLYLALYLNTSTMYHLTLLLSANIVRFEYLYFTT